jgi:3-hydroxyisobutyrate dehydrogenase-like beta-hydroxyacid dehydrogenase
MVSRVGYIGLGNMGKPIAANLVKAGFDVMVYDLRETPMNELAQAGAKVAGSAREVGAHSEVVGLSVVDDAQVEEAVLGRDGVLAGAKPGSIITLHSTIHPKTVKKVGAACREQGVHVLDAQVSGGQRGAKGGKLTFMVGGDKEVFEKCRPVFAASGTNIFYMGGLGTGAATKLAQQVIVCINRLSAYEGMKLAEKAGVDLKALQAVVHTTGAQSRIVDGWLQKYSRITDTDSTSAQGLAHLFWKGLCPALELGHELGLSMPATALVQQLFSRILGLEEEK